MSPRHQIEPVVVAKLLNSVPSEEIPSPSRRDRPAFDHFWVRPQQVAHGALLRHFTEPIYLLQIADFLHVGREPAVYAEDLVIDHGSDGEVVEDFGKRTPDVERAVLANALIVEAVDLCDKSGLVVASEQGDSVFVPNFESQQHEEGFNAVPSAIDIVAEEDIVGIGRVSSDLEELEQVVELSVDISADGDWRSDLDGVRLSLQDLLGQLTQFLDGGLLDLLTLFELLDYLLCHLTRTHQIYQIFSKIIMLAIVLRPSEIDI